MEISWLRRCLWKTSHRHADTIWTIWPSENQHLCCSQHLDHVRIWLTTSDLVLVGLVSQVGQVDITGYPRWEARVVAVIPVVITAGRTRLSTSTGHASLMPPHAGSISTSDEARNWGIEIIKVRSVSINVHLMGITNTEGWNIIIIHFRRILYKKTRCIYNFTPKPHQMPRTQW